jgi:tripartite-type tricarboxylate transporter receptor subunit TctC
VFSLLGYRFQYEIVRGRSSAFCRAGDTLFELGRQANGGCRHREASEKIHCSTMVLQAKKSGANAADCRVLYDAFKLQLKRNVDVNFGRTACLLFALAAALDAYAQRESSAYPSKPIRVIVPLAPGGAVDLIARGMSVTLAPRLGQTIVVDNRPGAGEAIGAELTARATPDGYTVLMTSAAVVVNPLFYPGRYDPLRDFSAVTQVTRQPYVLIVHPSVAATNARELVAWAKANPQKLNYASAGSGSLMHLTGELFKSATGVSMTHVAYKGMAQAYPDIIGGQVQVGFPAIITALPHLKSGKIRALGVTSRARVASLPEIPAISDSGVPGFEVEQWYGVFVPARTPNAVVARLHKEFSAVIQDADNVARMAATGSEAVGGTPAALTALLKTETERWGRIIRQAGIKVEQ